MKGSQKDGNKKREAKIETITVMFIPSTRGGLITSMMRESETEMSRIRIFKVKMQESGGIQLARLFSTDLAKGQPCGRPDCQQCEGSKGKTDCKKTNVLYESKSVICNPEETRSRSSRQEENHGHPSNGMKKEERKVGVYFGESIRSLYERSREHVQDAMKFNESSDIIMHWRAYHKKEDSRPTFSFRVIESF